MLAYEVIRIINSKPLFAIDHFERMQNSLKSINTDLVLTKDSFFDNLKQLILNENIISGNLRIEVETSGDSDELLISCYSIPHHYPTESDYKFGVNTVTYRYTRDNPNSKIWNQSLREKTDSIISLEKVFEVIYVNTNGFITEGSRSNIFFLHNKQLLSALPKDILLGITRKYIVETADKLGLSLVERNIKWTEIEDFDCAFISGTSPKILPIRKINDVSFQVNSTEMSVLISEFNKLIADYIQRFEF